MTWRSCGPSATGLSVLRAGVIRESRGTDELFAAPADPYTSELLAAVPDLPPGDYSGFASQI